MPRKPKGSSLKRSRIEWGVRGALSVLALGIGCFSISDTLANVVIKLDPARAHSLAPGDGKITAELAEQQFLLRPISTLNSEPARLARLALRQDATAVDAFTVLGLQAQLRDETDRARRLFAQSLAMSRRELQPRLWAIEEAIERGDISDALKNYDIALRTSKSAPDLLFPILASAIANPRIRSMLVEIMGTQPVWGERFVDFVAGSGVDPQAAIRFFREGERVDMTVEDADRSAVVNALVARDLVNEAWNYYSSFRPDAERRRSRDAKFARTSDTPAIFDWIVLNAPGISASIQQGESHGLVDFAAAPSTGGSILQQTQLLPPGNYRIEGSSIGIDQPERSRPYWSLTCRNGRELGRVLLSNSAQASTDFKGSFSVPSDCPVQILALVSRPSDEMMGVSGQIERVQLGPAG